jgi:hypothetical protein
MASKRRDGTTSALLKRTTGAMGKAVSGTQTARERINAFLMGPARVLGVLGCLALAACAVLWAVPEDNWPGLLTETLGLVPARLPVYAVASLIAASLLGWHCMQQGVREMRKAVGWQIGGYLFVLMPLACGVLALLSSRGLVRIQTWPYAPYVIQFVRYYPIVLVVLALATFVAWKVRDEEENQFGRFLVFGLMVGPYALLMSFLIFGFQSALLSGPIKATASDLGSHAIIIQVTLAYFLSAGGD